MIRVFYVYAKQLFLLTAFLAAFCADQALAASVETYVDEAVPPTNLPSEGQPLSAGALTMQDVLKSAASAKKKLQLSREPLPTTVAPPTVLPPLTSRPAATLAPLPLVNKTAPATNSEGSLLMQGMRSVFGAPTSTAPVALHPPGASAATATTSVPPTNIAKDVGVVAAPVAPSNVATAPNMSGCVPQTSSWMKTCAEAGYPDNFVGQIRGETRTTCPAGGLQDVWVSNSCVPPENGETGPSVPAVLTGPTPSTAPIPTGTFDGNCGPANGLAASAHPISDLCASGIATAVTGEGPWRWNCQGGGGGVSVSCAAPVASSMTPMTTTASTPAKTPVAEDAKCGVANGQVVEAAPTLGLCSKGSASKVNGTGPWTWACSGSNGGIAASCTALKKVDGVCGAADGSGSDEMPMAGLCDSGYASAVTGTGPWAWTCSGLNGGVAATCSASPRTNAVCGPASLNGHTEPPKNALCSVGQPGAITGNGPWTWTCSGQNGGASVSCEARLSQNGSCGSAHGSALPSAPLENLCTSGKASHVSGSGPWNWTCAGTEGGDTASCTATKAPATQAPTPLTPKPSVEKTAPAAESKPEADTNGLCGPASEFVAIEAPSKNLCKSGTASTVSGHGPWNWTCTEDSKQSSCSTLSLTSGNGDTAPAPTASPTAAVSAAPEPQSPSCGSVSGQGSTKEPTTDLCTVGKASSVSGKGPWTWTCSKGKSHVTCQADKNTDGTCGTANGSTQKAAPTNNLCSTGAATKVEGTGPWVWSCIGSGGGDSVSCSASAQAQTRVDGSCGSATNTSVMTTPSSNLCDAGVASAVYGEGPWTWTCSGMNGGVAASCSAMKNTPPAPPPPGPALNGLCGSANGVATLVQPMDNLCSTGTPSAISGNGPWNWNCIGENSGMAVSCTAPLQPPAPITGACGTANGVSTLTTPKAGLCSAGISSAVSGHGPWTWSCSGVNGGSAVGCVAPLAGAGAALPSMTTPSSPSSKPAASSAPQTGTVIEKKGLVTPKLPPAPLPPIETGDLPAAPTTDMVVPSEVPQLPDDTVGIPTPPVRDLIQPAPALRSDADGNVMPGNHFNLDPALSTVAFTHGSDNFDTNAAAILTKLAGVMKQNTGVRVTLTAYADNAGTTPREARRLSLSRALAMRDYLTSNGVSSARIDVRALGANVPSGEPDRVDIKAN